MRLIRSLLGLFSIAFLVFASVAIASDRPRLHRSINNRAARNVAVASATRALECNNGVANEYVNLGDVTTGGATQISVSYWLNNPAFGAGEDTVSKLTSSGNYEWSTATDSSRRLIWIVSGNGTTFGRWRSATNALSAAGTWDHVMMTFDVAGTLDIDKIHIWINGTDVTVGGVVLNTFVGIASVANVTLVADLCSSGGAAVGNPYSGQLDEVAIWVGSIVTPSLVRSAGSPIRPLSSLSPVPSFCWDFETGTMPTVPDTCGAFPGTAVNMDGTNFVAGVP